MQNGYIIYLCFIYMAFEIAQADRFNKWIKMARWELFCI